MAVTQEGRKTEEVEMDEVEGMPACGFEVYVYQAVCSGSVALGGEIGLPIRHVDAGIDVAGAISRLSEREHGAGARVPRMFQPIGFDFGWDDWRLVEYAPGRRPRSPKVPRPDGVRIVEGRIAVTLPAGVALDGFRERLAAELSRIRLQEVTSSMAYMEARSDACLDYVVEPRYTHDPVTRDFRGALRVDDLYVIDPADPWRLFRAVVAARLAAIAS